MGDIISIDKDHVLPRWVRVLVVISTLSIVITTLVIAILTFYKADSILDRINAVEYKITGIASGNFLKDALESIQKGIPNFDMGSLANGTRL